MIVKMNTQEVLKRQAEARFKRAESALDRQTAMTEYETQVLAIREKTAHLQALRLAKEAETQPEESAPKTNIRSLKSRDTR
jgi:hypothetical protein